MIITKTEKIMTLKMEVWPGDRRGAKVRRKRWWFLFLPVYTSFEVLEIQ